MKDNAILILSMIIGILIGGSIINSALKSQDSRVPYEAFKNSFINGCVSQGLSESTCTCGFNRLDNYYTDFTTNKERHKRIVTSGYTSAETDVVVDCF